MALPQITPYQISANTSANGQVLSTDGTNVFWANAASSGFSNGQSIQVTNIKVSGAIQGNASVTPPVFADSSNTEIGRLAIAFVRFVGSSGSIYSAFNVSSVSYVSTGKYTVNFARTLADSSYSFVSAVQRDTTGPGTLTLTADSTGVGTGSILLYATYNTGTVFNPTSASIAFFR